MNTQKYTYPVMTVDTEAVRRNAEIICGLCGRNGIRTAGVVNVPDDDVRVARAYLEGGCSQLASPSMTFLKKMKEELSDAEGMLIRLPMPSEAADVVRWADISLNSEAGTLRVLDRAAAEYDLTHHVILLLDLGDLREGVTTVDELCALAALTEELPNLHLRGIGTTFGCFSDAMPDRDKLDRLAQAAEAVEGTIHRKLEIVSGGSSVNIPMILRGEELPQAVNHLRIGSYITDPAGMRAAYGVCPEGLEEDTFLLTTEVVEVKTKRTPADFRLAPNWADMTLSFDKHGSRVRAIVASGSRDVGDVRGLIPSEGGIEIIGGSNDLTILDVTGCGRTLQPGDTVTFHVTSSALPHVWNSDHISRKTLPEELPEEA